MAYGFTGEAVGTSVHGTRAEAVRRISPPKAVTKIIERLLITAFSVRFDSLSQGSQSLTLGFTSDALPGLKLLVSWSLRRSRVHFGLRVLESLGRRHGIAV